MIKVDLKMSEMKLLISFELPNVFVREIKNVSSAIKIQRSQDKARLLNLVKDADILLAGLFSREMFLAGRRLKWIQTLGAGVNRFLLPEVVSSNVILTSAAGIHPTPVSEHVIGMILCLSRKLNLFIRNQMEKKWEENHIELMKQIQELPGKTVGIVGLGRIGTEIARKAKCLGMNVIATRKKRTAPKPPSVNKLLTSERLKELLAESDFVVLSLPLTKETEGMIGKIQLKRMKRTSYLINVSRGKIVQENDLVQALKRGWIAGAALDTFEKEPLSQDSELWSMENVLITPHVAGLTPQYFERLTGIFCENLNRFMNNEPLINVVDKNAGY